MATYQEISVAAGQVDGNLRKMGIRGKSYVFLEDPQDGAQLEADFSKHAKFSDLTLPSGVVVRTVTLGTVTFRWLKP